MPETYYQRLGVTPDASTEAIKTAYRRIVRQVHPDVDPNPRAAIRFKQVSEAYATLADPRKRLSYNQSVLAHAAVDSITRPGLTRRELSAAWQRVGAYLATGAMLGTVLLGLARWLGGTLHPWQFTAVWPTAGLGAFLGLLWGIDANFVVSDFVESGWLWLFRVVRLSTWVGGLMYLTRQLLLAVNLGHGALAASISHDALVGSAIVGLIIALAATLRDH